MASINLSFKFKAEDQTDIETIGVAGVQALYEEVSKLLDLVNLPSGRQVESYDLLLGDHDEYKGVWTSTGYIFVEGGHSEWEDWEQNGKPIDSSLEFHEELGDADWSALFPLIRAEQNTLGNSVYVHYDCLQVSHNWHNGDPWFSYSTSWIDARTPEEIVAARIASQERALEAQKQEEVTKLAQQERRKEVERFITAYRSLTTQFSTDFRFLNEEAAGYQGIRISPVSRIAVQFMEEGETKVAKRGRFRYKISSLDALKSLLEDFVSIKNHSAADQTLIKEAVN